MISPSPTQQPPEQPAPEKQQVQYTPPTRAGQTRTALFVKSIFRPIFKGLYYFVRGIRRHKLVSLIMFLLILGSYTAVNYAVTGNWPLGIASDPFHFHVRGSNNGGDQVQNWLYALRDGNVAALSLLDKNMSQPPDPQQLVSQYSQPQGHLSWKAINVISAFQESDTTIDTFVEVDLSANGPGGSVSGYMLWHFVSVAQQGGILLEVNLVEFRPSL